ncbi:MAG: DUF4294 domain-containing protein [Bacteroidales bacterium]|nr:DUF4294 domain-containing protein [Bacteroidales bacterium]
MKAYLLHILMGAALLCYVTDLAAQEPQKDNSVVTRAVVEGSDTLPIFELPEVLVYERRDFEYLYLKRRYRRMIRNIKKAYPYAQIAGVKLKELDDHLATLNSEKEQKAYINQAEKEIMDQFEKQVKRLTVTQGIILVKLIDRETGRTSYQVIKELKGGFTAFFWQGIARIFGNNLKTKYDPENQDKVMEDIVLGIEAGFI